MDILLFFLGAFTGWLVSRHYYRRGKRDDEASDRSKDAKEKWLRSVNYFRHMLASADWQEKSIGGATTWVCPSDTSLAIVVMDPDENFIEPWTERHPDPVGRRALVQLKVGASVIDELTFIHLDGFRIFVPMPRVVAHGATQLFFWESDSIEFSVARIVGSYYIHSSIEGVAKLSGVTIIHGQSRA